MKKLIHKYLNYNGYNIVNNKIVNININYFISSNKLIEELILVFCYSKKELKWYLKSWVKNKNQNFNFDEWWAPLPKFNHLDDYWIDFTRFSILERYGSNTINTINPYYTNITTSSNITISSNPNYPIIANSAHNTTTNADYIYSTTSFAPYYTFEHNTINTDNGNINYSAL